MPWGPILVCLVCVGILVGYAKSVRHAKARRMRMAFLPESRWEPFTWVMPNKALVGCVQIYARTSSCTEAQYPHLRRYYEGELADQVHVYGLKWIGDTTFNKAEQPDAYERQLESLEAEAAAWVTSLTMHYAGTLSPYRP